MDMPKINALTLTRLILAAIGVLNIFLLLFGQVPIEIAENTLYVAVSAVWSLVTTAWVAWKDNDCTKRARIRKLLGEAALSIEEVIEEVIEDDDEGEDE